MGGTIDLLKRAVTAAIAGPSPADVSQVDTGEVGRVELIEADYLHAMSPEMVAALAE